MLRVILSGYYRRYLELILILFIYVYHISVIISNKTCNIYVVIYAIYLSIAIIHKDRIHKKDSVRKPRGSFLSRHIFLLCPSYPLFTLYPDTACLTLFIALYDLIYAQVFLFQSAIQFCGKLRILSNIFTFALPVYFYKALERRYLFTGKYYMIYN